MNTISSRPFSPIGPGNQTVASAQRSADALGSKTDGDDSEVREKFTQFAGQTFYGQLMKAMRSTVDKPAYFHGGRGEEVFQGQLDQVLVDRMSKATASTFAEPMYELFRLGRP